MLEGSTLPPTEVLGHWQEFYAVLGAASATLVGLLFVAASVGIGAFSGRRRAALRIFLSASVVHFSSILAASLIVLLPLQTWMPFGVLIGACGLFGLGYSGLAWRDTVRDGLSARIDLEDRTWYVVLPVVGYLIELTAGILMALRRDLACELLAGSAGMLLVIGIHNAWDITVWSITQQQHDQP